MQGGKASPSRARLLQRMQSRDQVQEAPHQDVSRLERGRIEQHQLACAACMLSSQPPSKTELLLGWPGLACDILGCSPVCWPPKERLADAGYPRMQWLLAGMPAGRCCSRHGREELGQVCGRQWQPVCQQPAAAPGWQRTALGLPGLLLPRPSRHCLPPAGAAGRVHAHKQAGSCWQRQELLPTCGPCSWELLPPRGPCCWEPPPTRGPCCWELLPPRCQAGSPAWGPAEASGPC